MATTSPRPRPEEARLEALNAAIEAADRAGALDLVRKALGDKHARVVTRAATLAEERSIHEVIAELHDAYVRFLADPAKRDPHCLAKQAIVRALVNLECHDVPFYLQGIRYIQLEPVWGDHVDTAVDVRCTCAMGLVRSNYFRAVPELAALLADKEVRVREGAVRAISCGHPREAEAILRYKVHIGDEHPEVLSECFAALLAIAPEDCLPLVAAQLGHENDAVRDFAALALGESHHPGALGYLKTAWDEVLVSKEMRAVLIRAAAVHRSEAAFDWLLSIIETGARAHADVAVDALSVYQRNAKLSERVQAALARRST
jgi:hypothetical protein